MASVTKGKEVKTEVKTEIKTTKTMFKFRAINKTLWIGDLGIRFKDGAYETDNAAHAAYLRKVYGVEEV